MARGIHLSAMHLDEFLYEGQADTEATFGSIKRLLALREEVEDVGQERLSMPIPMSRTRITAWSLSFCTVSQICPLFSMYLAALFRRFVMT